MFECVQLSALKDQLTHERRQRQQYLSNSAVSDNDINAIYDIFDRSLGKS